MHPDHSQHLVSLNRIEGQIKGIKKMIEEQRYCIDIMTQTKAVTAAIRKVEKGILKTHIQNCLKKAVISGDALSIQEKVDEIMVLLEKRI